VRALRLALFALILSWSAVAFADGQAHARSQPLPLSPAHGAAQDKDLALLLDYLRAALRAASEGREAPPLPRELERRMNELGSEIKAHGTLAALVVLQTLEEQVKVLLREGAPSRPPGTLPPTVPYTPVSSER
jgi:hypothetical protein